MVLFSIESLSAQAFSNSKCDSKNYLERLNIFTSAEKKKSFRRHLPLWELKVSHMWWQRYLTQPNSPPWYVPSSPHVTSSVTTTLIVKRQHCRSQGDLHSSQRCLYGCQTPRKVNTASHRPLGKGLLLFIGAMFWPQHPQLPGSPKNADKALQRCPPPEIRSPVRFSLATGTLQRQVFNLTETKPGLSGEIWWNLTDKPESRDWGLFSPTVLCPV